MPGFPVHHQLLKLAQTHVHRVSDAIQPSHPLLSPSPPTFNLSQHQVFFFQRVSFSLQVAKILEFQLQLQFSSVAQSCSTLCDTMDCSTSGLPVHQQFISISPSEYSGLSSFRIDGLNLLSVQGILKSLLQHHSSKPSILQCSAFFTV